MNTVTIRASQTAAARARGDEDVRALMAEADAEVRDNWDDQSFRHQLLTDLVETIFEGFQHENLLPLFSTVETADEEERIFIEEVRGLEVFWVALGARIEASRMTERRWELKRDYVGFHVYELVRKMRNGFSRRSAELQAAAIGQMDAAISSRLFRTLQAAVTNVSPYYIGTPGLSANAVRTAITEVADEAQVDNLTIVGRRTMVDQLLNEIQDDNTYAPNTQEQIMRTGVLAQYRGANIVSLTNFKDLHDRSYFPANELWVLAPNASKTGLWGGLDGQEWVEQGGFYWHMMGLREAGFAVHKPERTRRIVDTNLSAGSVV